MSKKTVSRRDFVKATALGGGAMILAACAAPAAPAAEPAAVATAAPAATAMPEPTSVPTPAEPTSPVTLEMMSGDWFSMDSVVAAFEGMHPNIKIKVTPVSTSDATTKVQATAGEGQSTPDLYLVDQPRVPGWAAAGWLMDLTGRVPDMSGTVFDDAIQQSTHNGQLFSLPESESTGIVLFNRDLLSKAGVTPPDLSTRWTWEQVLAAAKKAQAAGAQYGIIWDQPDAYYQMQPLAESLGGGSGLTGPDNLTPDITNSGWVQAMTWYGQLYSDEVSPRGVGFTQAYDLFNAGKGAFLVSGPWAPSMIPNHEINMGLMRQPYFESGKPITPSGGWALGINPHTQYPDAALLFAEFMTIDGAGNKLFSTAEQDTPSLIANVPVIFGTEAYSWWPESASIPDLLIDELQNTAVARARTIGYPQFENIMTRAFTDIINGGDAASTLQRATSELQTAFAALK